MGYGVGIECNAAAMRCVKTARAAANEGQIRVWVGGRPETARLDRAEALSRGSGPRVGEGYQIRYQDSVSGLESSADGLRSQSAERDFFVKIVPSEVRVAIGSCV